MDLLDDDDEDWEELDTSEEGQGEHIDEVDASVPSPRHTAPSQGSPQMTDALATMFLLLPPALPPPLQTPRT
jgi:hypothetical protein